jgi:hypothetical protein
MNTFIDLYNYLISINDIEFKTFLNSDQWIGKDKLESVFRLFSYLNLIEPLNNYKICDGNYTNNTITKNNNIKKLFEKSLKDKGDKSDLTLINDKTIIASTCKNLSNYHINDLDIRDIFHIYETKYKSNGFSLILCIVIKNKEDIYKLCKNADYTSSDLVSIITNKSTIIIDYNELYNIFKIFISTFKNVDIHNLIKINKSKLILKYHQIVSIYKTNEILKSYNDCLWCHIARSGKSYIIAGYILEDSKSKDNCNYLIITTAPKETMNQYKEIFMNYYDFNDFNIIYQENIKKPIIKNKNIIICSKHFLQCKDDKKTRKIKWLSDLSIDIRFIDESHNGGTTEIAKSTFDIYGSTAKNIYITATYLKPLYNYNISSEQQILFNAYHIYLLKNIDIEDNYNKIIELFDENKIIDNFSLIDIKNYYNKLPELHYITESFNKDIKEQIKNIDAGYSIPSVLMLKHNSKVILNEFKNEDEVEKLIKSIFGISKINDMMSITDNKSLLRRCEIIAKNPEYNSRWFSKEEPLVILCFLPCNCENMPIDILSETLKIFIENKKLLEDYEIVCINSKNENKDYNPIDIIETTRNKAINNNKKAVLVFSGKKCSLGITIKKCDIVILMTNITSYDTIFQMMYRCMTEDNNKKCGFVIDLNLKRSIDIISNYGLNICPNKSSKEAIKYILEQKIINFNIDLWYDKIFGIKEINFNDILNNIYLIFNSQSNNSINKILDNIDFKLSLFSKDDQTLIKQLFKINYNKLEKINIYENDDIDINDGIEKIKVNNDDKNYKNDDKNDIKKEVKINKDENIDYFNEIIKKFIPLICLITISNDDLNTFNEIIDYINDNEYLKSIIEETINTWCNKKNKDTLLTFNYFYETYFKYNIKFNNIILEIREIFKFNLYNKKELSKSIDKYLIPHINEKKQNAEVSTPSLLRKEMIDKIPSEFWMTPKKVFEPCSGKAGFLLDIIDKFMDGLKEVIIDEEERYKIIIEECLYYSDINKQNIFIANLLLDPYKKYKLNFNEGDTLKLNIKEKWNLDGFDAIIGNPPYENINATGDNKLYLEFIKYSLNNLFDDKYLLFITPINIKNYITNQNKNRLYFPNFMKIIYLSLNTANKYFPNISTYFSYFLIQKSIIKYCNTAVSYLRKNKIETDIIKINENDNLSLCLSNNDITLINKVSNIINNNHEVFNIKKANYIKNSKSVLQRIRITHIKNEDVKKEKDDVYKYKIIDKINIKNPYPGVYYYNNYKMTDYGLSKVIMCTGGYLMPSYDEKGEYNLSDNMIYLLLNNYEEYNGLCILINSNLIKYLNKISMTDNIHGRDYVIQNIKYIDLSKIKNDKDIYEIYKISDLEINLINDTI